MLLVGAVGWGLLAFGATTHVWHHRRLRTLLAMHLDREAVPAFALTVVEVALTIALPVAVIVDGLEAIPLAVGATLLGSGFCLWIARLLLTKSELPCACSFSDAPTTVWSLARAAATLTVLALALATHENIADTIATFAVGLAVASGIFVLPDAIAWPTASRAILARSEAHMASTHRTDP